MPYRYANQVKYQLGNNSNNANEYISQYLKKESFFNKTWTTEQVKEALNYGYKKAVLLRIDTGKYTFQYRGETVTIVMDKGIFKTGYGEYKYTLNEFNVICDELESGLIDKLLYLRN